MAKTLTPAQLKRKRSLAAKKAWKTRRKNLEQIAKSQGFEPDEFISLYFRTLGRKGHEALEKKLEKEADKQGIPYQDYRKRYYTVQGRKSKTQYRTRTKKQKKSLSKRKPPEIAKPKAYRFADQIHFNVSDFNFDSIAMLIKELKSYGIHLMRFVREVQVGRYLDGDITVTPTGVASTKYFTHRQLRTEKQIRQIVGEMLIPGYDYVKELIVKEDAISKMPKPLAERFKRMRRISREEKNRRMQAPKPVR